ncbi:MAG: flippase activity-associated protein Agl23, partial [Nitrososphaerota archaeon]
MASESNKRTNGAQWRAKAARVFRLAPGTPESAGMGADGALALTGTETNTPEEDVSEADVVPVVSTVYDSTPVSERLAVRARRMWDYIRHMTYMQWLWIGVLLLATILRFWDLGAKPLHHDESMHAFFSLTFARNPSSYQYDPLLHGPFQFHAEGFVFMVLLAAQRLFGVGGAGGNPWINDATARILPALFGIGIVALPLGLQRQLGRIGALVAALLLAVSPAFVYFSRFLREDIYFNFFMFAMVVCAVQYAHKRTIRWLVGLFLATVFAYATFEGIYLSLVIFLSFFVLLVLWEMAHTVARWLPLELTRRERLFFSRAGLLLLAGGIGAALAHVALGKLNELSLYITKHTQQTDIQVVQLENTTVLVLLYLSIMAAIVVIAVLLWQISRDDSQVVVTDGESVSDADDVFPPPRSFASRIEAIFTAPGKRIAAIRDRIDRKEKPFLHLLLSIGWVHWFVAIVAGWILFAALYWVLPPGPQGNLTWGQGFQIGVGRGVWQGLYYWVQQQQVARGGQPVYYYLLLLPLYEQLAIVFGLAGAVYSLFHATRFRMFLVWWFVLSMVLYSWAGEKMPWLSIHILLPLMLLAAVMIERVIAACIDLVWDVREYGLRALALRPEGYMRFALATAADKPSAPDLPPSGSSVITADNDESEASKPGARALRTLSGFRRTVPRTLHTWRRKIAWGSLGAMASALLAVALFIPMVHSMVELAYIHPADGPHEMMVYVQTTPDVTAAMAKINYADQKLHGGRHQLQIWVGQGEEWPMYWYLRDYY